jgi:hypothetical protein
MEDSHKGRHYKRPLPLTLILITKVVDRSPEDRLLLASSNRDAAEEQRRYQVITQGYATALA